MTKERPKQTSARTSVYNPYGRQRSFGSAITCRDCDNGIAYEGHQCRSCHGKGFMNYDASKLQEALNERR